MQSEGQPYYVKTQDGRTYMTDTDVTKPDNLDRMQRHIDDMEVRISGLAKDLPEEFQICLEPGPDPDYVWYYMVNHDRDHRCIFWIDKFDLSYLNDEGLHSLSHWSACLYRQFSV